MKISPANIENTHRYYDMAKMIFKLLEDIEYNMKFLRCELLYTIRDRLSNTYHTRYKKASRTMAATDTNISIVNRIKNNILLYAKK